MADSDEPRWGRVLICGGTDWPKLGRKYSKADAPADPAPPPDLPEPHILRALSNVPVVSVHASCAGCHFVALDTDGAAWLFGRNTSSALGVKGESVSEGAPRRVGARELGMEAGERVVSAACGRAHTLLVGSDGTVWSAGANSVGQCGHPACPEVSTFKAIKTPTVGDVKEKIVKAAAGINFSLLLAESGRVYALGSGEHGQLGHGRTGEHIVTAGKTAFDVVHEPTLVRGLDGKHITHIACGQQHSVAIDDTGLVYAWGYAGYCRLGLGNQVDQLVPVVVPQFAGPNTATMARAVYAGPSCTVVVDNQGMYWMAGKWKNTGDGSGGQPYSSFRYMQDIMGCKILHAACGGVTHFCVSEEDGTIAWGQNAANGELGLGADAPKSATKPQKHEPLAGVDVFDIAAGQNTTLFLARPSDALSELPRHPLDVGAPEICVVCGADEGEGEDVLECEKCDTPYHLRCLDPPLDAVPDGEWFCADCAASPGAPVGKPVKAKKRARAPADEDEDGRKKGAATKKRK